MTRLTDKELRKNYVDSLEKGNLSRLFLGILGIAYGICMIFFFFLFVFRGRITNYLFATIWWIGITGIIPIILGIYAIKQIKKNKQQAKDNKTYSITKEREKNAKRKS